MFAKVFSQIFDSSIAEDYNCRRMFMDLLVLADSEGGVDMTVEAISRRTNVPIDEVKRCINELSQPDPSSRTKLHAGRRLTPLDAARDWGWQIVNYKDYRRIRDQEARREYFREQKRHQRAKKNVLGQKVDSGGRCQIVPSSSSSDSSSKKRGGVGESDEDWLARLAADKTYEGIDVTREHGKMVNWCETKHQKPTRARFINWLNRAEKPMAASATTIRPVYHLSFEERKRRKEEIQNQLNSQFKGRRAIDPVGTVIFTEEEKQQRERLRKEMESL